MRLVCVITKSKDPGETYPQSSLLGPEQGLNRIIKSIFSGRQIILNTKSRKVFSADVSQLMFSAQFWLIHLGVYLLTTVGHKPSRIG